MKDEYEEMKQEIIKELYNIDDVILSKYFNDSAYLIQADKEDVFVHVMAIHEGFSWEELSDDEKDFVYLCVMYDEWRIDKSIQW